LGLFKTEFDKIFFEERTVTTLYLPLNYPEIFFGQNLHKPYLWRFYIKNPRKVPRFIENLVHPVFMAKSA